MTFNFSHAVCLFLGTMFGVVALSWFLILRGVSPEQFRNSAVNAGKAEYYLDADHERQWRWKP